MARFGDTVSYIPYFVSYHGSESEGSSLGLDVNLILEGGCGCIASVSCSSSINGSLKSEVLILRVIRQRVISHRFNASCHMAYLKVGLCIHGNFILVPSFLGR